MQNGERNQGERSQEFKQHDSKNIVFICNNNNDGGNVPPVGLNNVWIVFIQQIRRFLPPGQLMQFEDYLEEELMI